MSKLWVVWWIDDYEGSTVKGFFSSEDAANECCESLRAVHRGTDMEEYYKYDVTQEALHDTWAEWAAQPDLPAHGYFAGTGSLAYVPDAGKE